jgi:hypothetical protein
MLIQVNCFLVIFGVCPPNLLFAISQIWTVISPALALPHDKLYPPLRHLKKLLTGSRVLGLEREAHTLTNSTTSAIKGMPGLTPLRLPCAA